MLFNLNKKLNIKKFTNKLFTIAAVAAALLGTGASVSANSSTVYARPRYHRVYRHHKRARRFHKISMHSRYVENLIRHMYDGMDSANQPVNYNTATTADMGTPMATRYPTVYVSGSRNLKHVVSIALRVWYSAGIYGRLTNNESQANVVIKYSNNAPDSQTTGDTLYDDGDKTSQRTILLYRENMKGFDNVGLYMVIIHEFGHVIGLSHDIDTDSVMSYSNGMFTNRRIARYYQMPWVTSANKRMINRLYAGAN